MTCLSANITAYQSEALVKVHRIGGVEVSAECLGPRPAIRVSHNAIIAQAVPAHSRLSLSLSWNALTVELAINKVLKAEASVVAKIPKATVVRMGELLGANVAKIRQVIDGVVEKVEGIKAKCSIICSLKDFGRYVRVSPAEIQWITDDVGVFYEVEANMEWIIVTD